MLTVLVAEQCFDMHDFVFAKQDVAQVKHIARDSEQLTLCLCKLFVYSQ